MLRMRVRCFLYHRLTIRVITPPLRDTRGGLYGTFARPTQPTPGPVLLDKHPSPNQNISNWHGTDLNTKCQLMNFGVNSVASKLNLVAIVYIYTPNKLDVYTPNKLDMSHFINQVRLDIPLYCIRAWCHIYAV